MPPHSLHRPAALHRASGTVLFLVLWSVAIACTTRPTVSDQTGGGAAGSGGGASGSAGLAPTGFGGGASGGTVVEPGPGPGTCAATSAAAVLGKGVDIIIVIDNSGSMSNEIEAVERNLN